MGRAGVRRLSGVSPEERNVQLEALVAAQAETIARLEARIVELEAQVGRNSGNSSLPPSRDGRDRRVRRAEEREQRKQARRDGAGESGRAPGKQPGAPGTTMRRREPDVTVTHAPRVCGHCKADLTDATVVGSACRQVVDIPEPRLVGYRPCRRETPLRVWACHRWGVPAGSDRADVLGTAGESRRGVSADPPTHPVRTSA